MKAGARKKDERLARYTLEPAAIKKLHAKFVQVVRRHVEAPDDVEMTVSNMAQGEWERSQAEKLEFVLRGKLSREVASRKRGAVPVFRLKGSFNLWVSWFVRWHGHGDKNFVLDAVSLGVWVGEEYSSGKRGLLRAEWDFSMAALKSGPAKGTQTLNEVKHLAAQPHWQIDHPAGFSVFPGAVVNAPELPLDESNLIEESSLESDSLEELDAQSPSVAGAHGFVLSRYHLGMRGEWGNLGRRGWQVSLADSVDDVPQWLDLCLEYLSGELQKYDVAEEVPSDLDLSTAGFPIS